MGTSEQELEPQDSLRWLANYFSYMRGQLTFYSLCKAGAISEADPQWWERESARLLAPIAIALKHAANLGTVLDYSYGPDAPLIRARAKNCASDLKRHVFPHMNAQELDQRLTSLWIRARDDAEFLEVRLANAEVQSEPQRPSGLDLATCCEHVNSRFGEGSAKAKKVIPALDALFSTDEEFILRTELQAYHLPPTTLDAAAQRHEGMKRGGHGSRGSVSFEREKLIWWATYEWDPG